MPQQSSPSFYIPFPCIQKTTIKVWNQTSNIFFADLINMRHGNSNSKVAVLNGLKRIYFIYITGGPNSSCEMIILRNTSHGGIIRVCVGIFTTALRNKKNTSNSQKKYLTLLPECIICYLTAYFDEKSPF